MAMKAEIPVVNLSEEQRTDNMRLFDQSASTLGRSTSVHTANEDGSQSSLDLKVPKGTMLTTPSKSAAAASGGGMAHSLEDDLLLRQMYTEHLHHSQSSQPKSNTSSKKTSSSSSSTSKGDHPQHVRAMMEDGVPVSQWVVLLVLLGAGLWQMRKVILGNKLSPGKKHKSVKKQPKGNTRKGKKSAQYQRQTRHSEQAISATKRQAIIEELEKTEEENAAAAAAAKSRKALKNAKSNKKKRQKAKANKAKQQPQKEDEQLMLSKGDSPDSVSTDESSSGTAAENVAPKAPMDELNLLASALVEQEPEDVGEWETVGAKGDRVKMPTPRVDTSSDRVKSNAPSLAPNQDSGTRVEKDAQAEQDTHKPTKASVTPSTKEEESVGVGVKTTEEEAKQEEAENSDENGSAPVVKEDCVDMNGRGSTAVERGETEDVTKSDAEPEQAKNESVTEEQVHLDVDETPQDNDVGKEESAVVEVPHSTTEDSAEKVDRMVEQAAEPEADETTAKRDAPSAMYEEIATPFDPLADEELAQQLQAEELAAYEKQQEQEKENMNGVGDDGWEQVATKKKKKPAVGSAATSSA